MFNAIGAFFLFIFSHLGVADRFWFVQYLHGFALNSTFGIRNLGGCAAGYFYLGLVFGARVGHKLILGIGHIRAYAASAAFVTVAVLVQILVDNLWVWLVLRFIAGAAMVTQFIGIESWLNEQTDNENGAQFLRFIW